MNEASSNPNPGLRFGIFLPLMTQCVHGQGIRGYFDIGYMMVSLPAIRLIFFVAAFRGLTRSGGIYVVIYQGLSKRNRIYEWDGRYLKAYQDGQKMIEWDGQYVKSYSNGEGFLYLMAVILKDIRTDKNFMSGTADI